jgi:hypothetical protein
LNRDHEFELCEIRIFNSILRIFNELIVYPLHQDKIYHYQSVQRNEILIDLEWYSLILKRNEKIL